MELTSRAPAIRSRRERPAKPALSREAIVEAAVRVFHEDGLSRVTLRRLATELDTGHASLYVYLRDTSDLHAEILDVQLAEVRTPNQGAEWRSALIALLIDYGRVLLAHPDLAAAAIRTRPEGPNSARIVETILQLLAAGGITGRTAAWGVDLLLQYPTAIAAEHAGTATEGIDEPDTARTAIDVRRHPLTAGAGEELGSGTPLERATWAVGVLIDGLHAQTTGHRRTQEQR